VLAFPFRIGGPGLQSPEETADFEYANFTLIAAKLTAQVYSQKLGNSRDHERSRTINSIMKELNDFTCRMPRMPCFDLQVNQHIKEAVEKGASSWHSAMPIIAMGYALI